MEQDDEVARDLLAVGPLARRTHRLGFMQTRQYAVKAQGHLKNKEKKKKNTSETVFPLSLSLKKRSREFVVFWVLFSPPLHLSPAVKDKYTPPEKSIEDNTYRTMLLGNETLPALYFQPISLTFFSFHFFSITSHFLHFQ
jgi:hypothetical protein